MAEFVCKVADAAGRVFSQVEAAQSVTEARQKLSDRGLYVYSVEPRGGLLGQSVGGGKGRVLKSSDFLIFNQQLNTLIKAGLPILKALDLLGDRAASPSLQPLLKAVRDRVREGAALSEALEQEGLFPKVYVTSVLAGEKSGNLSGVLEYYIAYQKLSTGAKKKLIATLIPNKAGDDIFDPFRPWFGLAFLEMWGVPGLDWADSWIGFLREYKETFGHALSRTKVR